MAQRPPRQEVVLHEEARLAVEPLPDAAGLLAVARLRVEDAAQAVDAAAGCC